jgi:transposase InsO family protein
VKYRFITDSLREYPRWLSCKILQVSRTGYYHWLKRRYTQRRIEEEKLLLLLRKHHQLSRGRYGLLRLTKAIGRQGVTVNKKRVYRLMKKYGIFSKTKKKFKVTTKQDSKASFSANLLHGKFEAENKNQIWTSDITYIWTQEGWLYLAVVLDVYNREIIGWSLDHRSSAELVLNAFSMAMRNRKPEVGIILHSDRGSQYTSARFRNTLAYYGFIQSMSGKGNCYDNAITESFFSTLKKELIYLTKFETKEQAAAEIFEFIEIFYNRKRLHSALGYVSPVEFKMKTLIVRKDSFGGNKKEESLTNINQTVAYLAV